VIASNAPRILVVDDQSVNRMFLAEILRKEGYETMGAEDGPSARAAVRARPPDLILLDVMMPGESGFETCELLQRDPSTAGIPIIFISAADDAETKVRGLSLGAVDYVARPFHREEVLARVRIHLRLARADNERTSLEASHLLREVAEAQSAILADPGTLPAAKFAVARRTVGEAGGDFYDVVPLGTGIFGYFVADVSGHGLGVSFTTPMLKALLAQNAAPMFKTAETLKVMNAVLHRLLKDGQHITASFLRLNRSTSKAETVSAGHPFAIHLPVDGAPRALGAPGDVLGAFDHIGLSPVAFDVRAGDRLFLYTDGLVESGPKGLRPRTEGEAALLEALASTRSASLEKAVARTLDRMLDPLAPPRDDAILLGIEV
jgi:sigma-B regulation protein RsbU (phosphoserine phosphatase)